MDARTDKNLYPPGEAEHIAAPPRPRRRVRGLTGKILALNILALAVLVGGILYFNQYRTGLVQTRMATLIDEAEMIAAAIGESNAMGPDTTSVDIEAARAILQRMTLNEATRARLFTLDGNLALDSRRLIPTSQVEVEALPPP